MIKRKSIKFLSVLLSVLMLASVMPSSVYAIAAEDIADSLRTDEIVSTTVSSEEVREASSDVYALGEDVSKRTENAKYIRMSDGSYYVAMYNSAVHYLDGDVWEEIDNTLASSSASDSDDIAGVATSKGKHIIKFANNSNSSKLVAIKQGNYKISFNLVGANKSKGITVTNPEAHSEDATELERLTVVKKSVSSVMYEDILDGVDLEYIVNGNNLKENIIVKSKADEYVYQFDIKLDKLTAEQLDDGKIVLVDEKTGEIVYTITTPYMVDANGKYSDKVTYSLERVKNKEYRITVTADSEWMNDENRAFPVTIDPPIKTETDDIEDAYIMENVPDVNTGNGAIHDVSIIEGSNTYTLWKTNVLPVIPSGSIVTNASLTLCQYSSEANVGLSSVVVTAHEVSKSWSESTVTWNTFINPIRSGTIDFQNIGRDYTQLNYSDYITWNITRVVKNWYLGADNNGIALKVLEGSTDDAYVSLISNDYVTTDDIRPVLTVSYRSMVGLEDYYTYQTQSIGRAGVGYISDYTSDLTLVNTILHSDSATQPFAISNVYNDAYSDRIISGDLSGNDPLNTSTYSAMQIGLGWKLNIQESLIPILINGVQHYVYMDADGTEHFFVNKGTEYVDEDGLGLTMTVFLDNSTFSYTCTMTDKQGNQKLFKNGKLFKIIDADGNTVQLIYNTSDGSADYGAYHVSKVIRYNAGNTEANAETIATLSYSGQYLSAIYDAYGRATTYTYIDGRLTQITYPDGATAVYTYDENSVLTSAFDSEANYGISYSTAVNTTLGYVWHKERAIQEYYIDNGTKNYGKALYSYNTLGEKTFYTDVALGILTNQIISTYSFDNRGRSVNVYTSDLNSKIYGASTAVYTETSNEKMNNHIESIGSVGTVSDNLFDNGSAERDSSWTFVSGASYSSTKAHTGHRSILMGSTSASVQASFYQIYKADNSCKYTASAYVDVSGLTFASGGGIYLKAVSTDGTVIGDKLNVNLTQSTGDNWQRIYITFDAVETHEYTIYICMDGVTGNAYVDDIQLEENSAPSSYNLVEDFDLWNYYGVTRYEAVPNTQIFRSCIGLASTNAIGSRLSASYIIPINKSANTTFHLSGWAYATSTPRAYSRTLGLAATIYYTNGESETMLVPFNEDLWNQPQFAQGVIAPTKTELTISYIKVAIVYENHLCAAYVYDVVLVEDDAATYSYDDEGNLVAVNQTDTSTISSVYDSLNNLTSQSQGNTNFAYTYYEDSVNEHRLHTVTNDGVTMEFAYDSVGNVTGTVVRNISDTWTLSSSNSYSSDGDLLVGSEDANGIALTYGYDNKNLLTHVTNEKNVTVRHGYNEYNDREVTSYISGIVSVNYNYLNGSLASIVRGGYVSGDSTKYSQTYSFEYDGFGNTTRIMVGNYTLVTYEYNVSKGYLTKTTYGNGTYVENVYDELDRIVEIKVNGATKYNYVYNGEGELHSARDIDNNITICYNYDSLGRILSTVQRIGETVNSRTHYTYDDKGRASEYYCGLSGATGGTLAHTYAYTYDEADNSLTIMTVDGENFSGDDFVYVYDTLKRLSKKYLFGQYRTFVQNYTYKTLSGTRTSTLISGLNVTSQGSSILSYTYSYDDLGNITGIYKDGVLAASYGYDDQGQLTSEIDHINDLQYIYVYDTYGNIRYAYKYTYSTATYLGTDTYGYTNTSWLDRLTSFNGANITYDAIGNPLSYNNGSAYTFTWQNGRELASVVKGGVTTTYKYGADGQRIEKKYGSTTYNYYYADGLLVRQTWGTHYIDFLYDESGSPYSLIYDGVQYYYVKNVQGDVVQIRSSYGTLLVEYTYDAWGNVLSITGSNASVLGANNPIRYRSYYYDFETGFYYLQSRYYDPEIRRFINADGYVNANGDFIGFNMYAYCSNNPVMYVDYSGYKIKKFLANLLTKSTFSFIEYLISESNYNENYNIDIDISTTTKSKTITNQYKEADNFKFGFASAAETSCEVIAVHNIKVALGFESTLSDTIKDFQEEGAMLLGGFWGSNPLMIGKVLDRDMIHYRKVGLDNMTTQGYYIISFFNEGKITRGIHTVAIYYDGNTYTAYNKGGGLNFDNPTSYAYGYICGYYVWR